MLTPGPKEPTAEQLCKFNRLLVNDLIELYEHSIVMKTPQYPEGRRVKVALMAIIWRWSRWLALQTRITTTHHAIVVEQLKQRRIQMQVFLMVSRFGFRICRQDCSDLECINRR